MGEPVISMSGVTKRFGRTVALEDFALSVTPGEVHGFLGPNGAGKTTTLRLLLGMLRADSGSMRVLGGDPWQDATSLHARLAYVPGDVNLWPNLTGGEVIDLLANLRGGINIGRKAEYLQRFDLDPTKKGRTYSKGNRQKVALISALASDVELYLLDEPTAGLDPLMEAEFRDCVRALRNEGRTVLLSSHILSEAEALSDRVTIIRDGRAVESGSLDQLRHLTATAVTATVSVPPTTPLVVAGVPDIHFSGNVVTASVPAAAMPDFVAALAPLGVQALTSAPPTLEELFLSHYRAEAGTAPGTSGKGRP
jgi:ABC-2 type transport system ATP-binding protein